MKTVKIDFLGFWRGFEKNKNFIYNILSEKYNVEISSNPDFLFCSIFADKLYDYLKNDCVRILYVGEPFQPDFNCFDYAIGFDYIDFPYFNGPKRYFRYPLIFIKKMMIDPAVINKTLSDISKEEGRTILKHKKFFCNCLYSHDSIGKERSTILDLLSEYKKVDSAGSWRNNMEDNRIINYTPHQEKINFLSDYKFTIAFESMSYHGFETEKLFDAYLANTVPIYFGNPSINDTFNPNSMINVNDFGSMEDVVKKVIEIDNNDDLYLQMLCAHKLNDKEHFNNLYNDFKNWLWDVVGQDRNDAYRRIRHYRAQKWTDKLYANTKVYEYEKLFKDKIRKIFKFVKR